MQQKNPKTLEKYSVAPHPPHKMYFAVISLTTIFFNFPMVSAELDFVNSLPG